MAAKKAVKKAASKSQQAVSTDEQVGYHKGSLQTLMKEREELLRLVGIVEHLIQMHSSALKDLGVDVQGAQSESPKQEATPKRKIPIDELI